MIAKWRYGAQAIAVLYLLGGIYLNYVFVYALIGGKMMHRYRDWIEARESLPVGYWIYVMGFGGAAIFTDIYFLWILRNALKKPSQPPVPTRGTRP